jgi:rhodanese-related sulfurtransferase
MAKTILLTLLAAAAISQAAESKVKQLSVDEIKSYQDKKDIFWLDVREPKELEEGGAFKGAVNIPLGQLESRLGEVPKDKVIITNCAHGVRAARAADLLVKNGYKVAGACGLADYKAQGNPVVYPKPKEKK